MRGYDFAPCKLTVDSKTFHGMFARRKPSCEEKSLYGMSQQKDLYGDEDGQYAWHKPGATYLGTFISQKFVTGESVEFIGEDR